MTEASQDDNREDAHLVGVLAHVSDAVVTVRADGTVAAWNPAAERLFGITADAALGADLHTLLNGAGDRLGDMIAATGRGEAFEREEVDLSLGNGRQLSLSVSLVPVRGGNGAPESMTLIAQDLAGYQAAQRTDALLAAVVSSSDDAIVSKSLEGIITSWNAGAEALLGYTAEEVIGRHISMIAPPGRKDEMPTILARIAAGSRVDHFDTQRLRKDGHLIDVSLTVSPIRDGTGRIIGASKIARDVTERKRNEARTRLLLSELDHRTKNMLAIVQSVLRLTQADNIRDFVSVVEGRVQALARVHTEIAHHRWDGAYLDSLLRMNVTRGVYRDVEIKGGPTVFLGPQAAETIGIVFYELATNAARHGAMSMKGGRVEVDWELTESRDLILRWFEHGSRGLDGQARRGFGMRVIERLVPEQIQGGAQIDWMADGLQCTFTIPSAALAPPPSQIPPDREETLSPSPAPKDSG